MSLQLYNDIFSEPFEKQIEIITYGGTVFTNSDICEESLIIEDSLCSEENLMFGACEAKCLKVRVIDKNISLKNRILTVTIKCNLRDTLIDSDGNSIINHDGDVIAVTADAETDIKLGVFAVFSAEPSNDRSWIDIVAYDQMYTLLNADLSSWYNQLNFPMTVKQLRDSLFNGLQISQVTTTLVNDSFVVEGGFLVDGQLSGKTVIEAICELNGVFGHFTPDNEFEFIDVTNTESVTLDHYVDGTGIYSSYATNPINKIVARSSEDDVGTSVGSGNNVYILENNPLIFGKEGTPELTAALTDLFNKIKVITFRPFEVETYGNPMLPVGSRIVIPTRDVTINSIVMTKVMRGIQALRDNMSASGDLNYPSTVNNVQSQISRTLGKVHNLRIDVDELTSEMISVQSIKKKAIKVYACTSYSTYYPSSDPQDARIRLDVPITDGSFETLGNSESTKIGITLPSNFDTMDTNERDLKIIIGPTEIIAPIYYDGSALTNQIAAKGGDIMYFNLSTDASGNYSADVIMDTTSRSLISQTAEGIELMVSEINGVNVPVYEMTSYNYDSVNDVVTIYAEDLPFDSLLALYDIPHRVGIKLKPMTATQKAAKKEVWLYASSDNGNYISVTGWVYDSNNNIVTDEFDGDNIIYLEYDERTISGSDTFGFWIVTDTYSQSQIEMTNSRIVMRVDSTYGLCQVELGADATSGSHIQLSADDLSLTANNVIDFLSGGSINMTSKNISITSTNFSVTSAGAVTCHNLTVDGGSINLGNGVFSVTNAGAVSCSNLTVTGGSINLGSGVFNVTNTGAVTCSNLTVTGGSMNINNAFKVDTSGKLTCTGADISGKITANDGTIGGWTMNSAGLYSGSYTFLSPTALAIGTSSTAMTQMTTDMVVINRNYTEAVTGKITPPQGTFTGVYAGELATNPNYAFFNSNGNIRYTGTIQQASSRNAKENIKDLSVDEANKLFQLKPRSFDLKKGDKDRRGFIAEEVLEVLPNLVEETGSDALPYTLNYMEIIPYLVKICQEQQKEISALKENMYG